MHRRMEEDLGAIRIQGFCAPYVVEHYGVAFVFSIMHFDVSTIYLCEKIIQNS